MAIVLGANQYGKAETRVVRIYRDTARHELRDLNVTTALRGDFAAAHVSGDQASVLPTDSQKNTVFAYAKSAGIGQIEDYALALARHFVRDVEPVQAAQVDVEEFGWARVVVGEREHEHTWVRQGPEVRTATATVDSSGAGAGHRATVVSGIKGLTLLKSTGSEFAGFLRDEYTTLEQTHDRVMATSLQAWWQYGGTDVGWGASYDGIRAALLSTFATFHSLALQQTLWEMGRAVLHEFAQVAQISFSAPNKHHVAVDLSPFGLGNPGEVFHATDRPYGLIECTVAREERGPESETGPDVPDRPR